MRPRRRDIALLSNAALEIWRAGPHSALGRKDISVRIQWYDSALLLLLLLNATSPAFHCVVVFCQAQLSTIVDSQRDYAGKEAVTWLAGRLLVPRDQAVQRGRALQHDGLFSSVEKDVEFSDSSALFRFAKVRRALTYAVPVVQREE